MSRIFRDRRDAGIQLAAQLSAYADDPGVIVLGLPRGGVPVAYEVACALHAPLDVFVVRKLGVPGHRELAMGAIASGGVRVLNPEVVDFLHISSAVIDLVTERERQELDRQEQLYRGNRSFPSLDQGTVIVVDDGLATGSTMLAAVRALKTANPARIVVAAPVAARETTRRLKQEADEVVCAIMPDPFYAVSAWYQGFEQTSDEEVKSLLEDAADGVAERQPCREGERP